LGIRRSGAACAEAADFPGASISRSKSEHRDFYSMGVENMARITVEDCLKKVGDDNRFALIHLAVERIRQHRKGEPFLVADRNKEIVLTLREIAAGRVTFDNIHELPKQRKAEKTVEAAVDGEAAEE